MGSHNPRAAYTAIETPSFPVLCWVLTTIRRQTKLPTWQRATNRWKLGTCLGKTAKGQQSWLASVELSCVCLRSRVSTVLTGKQGESQAV